MVDVDSIPIGLEDATPWDLYSDNLASMTDGFLGLGSLDVRLTKVQLGTNALVEAGVATGLRYVHCKLPAA
eukprot:scaffold436_cov267-Pinguiococcus_pyrenoidosus.AAC.11